MQWGLEGKKITTSFQTLFLFAAQRMHLTESHRWRLCETCQGQRCSHHRRSARRWRHAVLETSPRHLRAPPLPASPGAPRCWQQGEAPAAGSAPSSTSSAQQQAQNVPGTGGFGAAGSPYAPCACPGPRAGPCRRSRLPAQTQPGRELLLADVCLCTARAAALRPCPSPFSSAVLQPSRRSPSWKGAARGTLLAHREITELARGAR